MRSGRRIKAIYTKELLEILRDRRTLIAMVVVPIALYPLLIIGSVHLLSLQNNRRAAQPISIAVQRAMDQPDENQPDAFVKEVISQMRNRYAQMVQADENNADAAKELESVERMSVDLVSDASAAVAQGVYPVGMIIKRSSTGVEGYDHYEVTLQCDRAEISSQAACERVDRLMDAAGDVLASRFLENFRIPREAVRPIEVEMANVATPQKVGGMVLGSIVPLVLVLMTITGAIYPAIDLTAGERERGTLETILACPVPAVELITGKYLVVATIAMLGASLNLISVGATLYFGGFTSVLSDTATELPLAVLPVILLSLIPFALLFSAIMVAVCSYARTFKEAQNYIMPVILAALIPGGVAALPGTGFENINTVVPVMNMVLLARELLLGHYEWAKIALVLVSTTMYASVAVIIASRIFSTESVVFADSLSLRSAFSRRLMRRSDAPSQAMSLIVVSLLFPTWVFIQGAIQPAADESVIGMMFKSAWLMPLVLVGIPLAVMLYWKVNVWRGFALRLPLFRFVIAGLLIGASAWVLAHEIFVLQSAIVSVPKELLSDERMTEAFADRSIWFAVLLIAVIPGVCEELLFRGFLLSGVRQSMSKWPAIVTAAVIFGIFHMLLYKFVHTAGVGLLLGYLCWQSRSIWPAIVAHVGYNLSAVLLAFWPPYKRALGLTDLGDVDHLPGWLILISAVMVVAGVLVARSPNSEPAVVASVEAAV